MPGQVPLSNAKFINSPDFDNQAIQGITGSGVFRQFTPASASSTISSSDLWTLMEYFGNTLVAIPSGISANVGDEILFVNASGTISFQGFIDNNNYPSVKASRPARLVYIGANYWSLAGAKFAYTSHQPTDCCGNSQPAFYTVQAGTFAESYIAYSDPYGRSLYTSTSIGNVINVPGAESYIITSGNAAYTPCAPVSYSILYTLYNDAGSSYNFYSYQSVDIFDDAAIIGVPFRDSQNAETYPCNVSPISGTWYRSYGDYGAQQPVCFSNGVIIAATACP
jgi:hypothetical protein